MSGRICDETGACADGCRPDGSHGCSAWLVCQPTGSNAGQCVLQQDGGPQEDGGVQTDAAPADAGQTDVGQSDGPEQRLAGGGCTCTAAGAHGGSAGAFLGAGLVGLMLAGLRRRRASARGGYR